MKVLLLNPCWDYNPNKKGPVYNRKFPPVELANIAALLEMNNIKVSLYDANLDNISPDKVAEKAIGFDKIFITSSTLDKWICPNTNIDIFVQTTKKISSVNNNVYLLGAHPTVFPKKILSLTGAKAAIIGEPELIASNLVLMDDLSKIKGIAYFNSAGIYNENDKAKLLDLNNMPIPSFHLLKKGAYYYEVLGNDMMIFEASRGCSYPCIFCFKSMYGNSVRKKDPYHLIDEIKKAIATNNIKTAYFMDLEFTIAKKNVMQLCDLLISNGAPIKWCCQTRADAVDKNLLEKMKQAGCTLIHYGVETASERIMKLIKKNITKDKIIEGINLTKESGIDTACFFMFGFPTETKQEMDETIEFAKELNPTYASFHIAIPYPNTELYHAMKTKEEDAFPTHFVDEFTLDELFKVERKAFFSYYIRLSYIIDRLLNANLPSLWKQFKIFLWYIKK